MKRTCHFCFMVAEYNDLPDGTVVYLGICACGDCLANGKASDFRQLVEVEVLINQAAFVGELEFIGG